MTITLITGANRGLGLETARALIASGHTVYTAARKSDDAKRTAKELGGLPVVVDVTDDETVRAAAELIEREHGVLDVLINNAGVNGGEKPPAEYNADQVTRTLDTNVLGIVRMMHAFIPLLQRSGNGVVVNMGSGLGSFGRVHDPDRVESKVPNTMPYAVSKAAVAMLTVQYAKAHPELRVNVVDPGPTATEINGFRGFQTVEEGAAPIIRAATIGSDGPTGTYFDGAGICPW